MSKEIFMVRIRYSLSDEADQFLVDGTRELAKLINLLCSSDRYSLVSIDKLGKIGSYSDLIQDLIDEQKPDDLDCSVRFIDGKENSDGSQKQRH